MIERHQAGATMDQVIVRCCHRELNAAHLIGNCLIQPQEWEGLKEALIISLTCEENCHTLWSEVKRAHGR
jgi:hypothetical protein